VKQVIYNNYGELSKKTAEQIVTIIKEKPDALLCFAAGETSVGTFQQLVEFYKAGKISFKKCRIVGLDEWTNLGDKKIENCLSFLKKQFFNHIDYDVENLCFFNGEATDLQMECKKTDDFINQYGPIDMILLGVGMNGHLGLNEPGVPFDLYSHIVELDETTKIVGQKYFSGYTILTSGISLGLKHVLEAKTVILQMNGLKKAPLVRRLIDSEISPVFPASIVKSHPNAFLLLDKESSKLL